MEYPACMYGGDHVGDAYAVRNRRGATLAGLCSQHFYDNWEESPPPSMHLLLWKDLAKRGGEGNADKQGHEGMGGPSLEDAQGEDSARTGEETGIYRDNAQPRQEPGVDNPSASQEGARPVRGKPNVSRSRGEEYTVDAPGHFDDITDRTPQSPASTFQGGLAKEIARRGETSSSRTVRAEGSANGSEVVPFAWWQGAGELVLEQWQRDILQAPFDMRLVQWNYNNEHYIPWVNYWKRLLDAFAPSIPQLVPLGEPKIHNETVSVHYVMLCNGQFIGEATGEMSKKGGNKTVTYARCVEGCASDAITRIGKRLGMGLELWDPVNIEILKEGRKRG